MTPKFRRWQAVRIPHVTPGHDNHNPKAWYIVEEVYSGETYPEISYRLRGLPSIWPETRLTNY